MSHIGYYSCKDSYEWTPEDELAYQSSLSEEEKNRIKQLEDYFNSEEIEAYRQEIIKSFSTNLISLNKKYNQKNK